MRSKRFQLLINELTNELQGDETPPTFLAYRLVENTWKEETTGQQADATALTGITEASTSGSNWRAPNSTVAFFPITSLDAVVSLEFSTAPKASTRTIFSQRIDRCLRHSENEYRALYDTTTGLLSRAGLEAEVKSLLVEIPSSIETVTTGMGEPSASIWVLALDIDHFKQINDTFGHLYGDVVLKCFAQRILDESQRTESHLSSGARIRVARSGGEEFFVVVSGTAINSEVESLSESLRRVTAESPLPTEAEWQSAYGGSTAGLSLPHPSERKVTVSIGVSSGVCPRDKSGVQFVEQLKNEADAALYRAKTSGRNTVRWFSGILQSGGRVLEHHQDTGIVAIDIGRQVKVRVGQEFLVYHPDFSGFTPFVFSDGRTKKRIGTYPKMHSGRIIVFDSQQEMSFCATAEVRGIKAFPPGSVLEAIPLGSITHLLPSSPINPIPATDLSSVERLSSVVEELSSSNSDFSVIAFSLENSEPLSESRGSVFINASLARLYDSIRQSFPSLSTISQIQPMQFATVVTGMTSASKVRALMEKTLEQSTSASHGLTSFGAGAFISAGDSKAHQLPAKHALEFARYAVSPGMRGKEKFAFFLPHEAWKIVHASRDAGVHLKGIADYHKLKELGVQDAKLENQAATCAMEAASPIPELALSASQNAVTLDPKPGMYWANRAVAEFFFGDRSRAYDAFLLAPEVAKTIAAAEGSPPPNGRNFEFYSIPYSLSMHARYRQNPKSIDIGILLRCLKNASSIKVGLRLLTQSLIQEVEAALKELGAPPVKS
ncbi:GGDEF domain-containing protein [Corallococcus sp. CA047B]|uniref:GGDEF domain-containing protein n=1 Tax=Corallococcus sp. CA047B TaxID=2316729 RepID=UPI000EA2E21D|nr:GGDEF domain-containing protein [Corallococcus sp. CA047B]RKH16405.1 GGDEF domain-containing protein [Corallococcus sp. CA047B]